MSTQTAWACTLSFAVGLALLTLVPAGCGGDDDSATPAPMATTATEAETTTAETTATESSEATPDPKDLVVQLSDLPTGYSVDESETGPRSLDEALKNTTPEQADVIRRERVAGYEVTFDSPNLRVINCTATVYRSPDGAAEVYRLAVERASNAAGIELTPASISEVLGDETDAFTGKSQGAAAFVILWRDENVLGFCAHGGFVTTDPDETVRVAQAQQERIAAALQ